MKTDQEVKQMASLLLRSLLDNAAARGEDMETVLVVLGLAHDAGERILMAATVMRPGATADLQAARERLKRLIAESLPDHERARQGADAAHGVTRTAQ
jgi:hypothetical protein